MTLSLRPERVDEIAEVVIAAAKPLTGSGGGHLDLRTTARYALSRSPYIHL